MHRRTFLAASAAAIATACTDTSTDAGSSTTATQVPPTTLPGSTAADTSTSGLESTTTAPTTMAPHVIDAGESPFGLGVASGDPTSDAVVIWTRLADGSAGNPTHQGSVEVAWFVTNEPDVSAAPIASGTATTDDSAGHSVHVDVTGLDAGSTYHYWFEVDGVRSPVGRTNTLDDDPERVRLIVTACQHYEDGYFTAWRHAAAEGGAVALQLGDAIYTRDGVGSTVRSHGSSRPGTLDEFRRRWALYRSDVDMQAGLGSMPYVSVWDDNEVASNYAGTARYGGSPTEEFAAFRAAAYQAWWEHQPTRVPAPTPAGVEIHRRLDLGSLATIWMLDGRQYRSRQVCDRLDDFPAFEPCEAIDDPDRTMLGAAQEAWLDAGLAASAAEWQVIANQTVVADWLIDVIDIAGINNDQWDGYRAARTRLLASLAAADRAVIVSGDVHMGAVNTIAANDGRSFLEIVTPSLTSRLDDRIALGMELAVGARDNVEYLDTRQHGYIVVDLAPGLCTATYRHVDATETGAPVTQGPVVETNGRGNTVLSE